MKHIKILQKTQAETYLLLIKTHNFHWNVKGPLFQSLHTLFEAQYNELFLAVDVLAERLKALNQRALGSAEEFLKISSISGSSEEKWKKMIKELVKDHQQIVKDYNVLIKLSQKSNDESTADLAIERIEVHQKHIWMLESHLK